MSIQVTGILPDPLGNPLTYTTIRITTVESNVSPKGAFALTSTDDQGNYSFTLSEGKVLIEFNQGGDEYQEGTYVEVTGSDTGSINLPLLLLNNAYIPSL